MIVVNPRNHGVKNAIFRVPFELNELHIGLTVWKHSGKHSTNTEWIQGRLWTDFRRFKDPIASISCLVWTLRCGSGCFKAIRRPLPNSVIPIFTKIELPLPEIKNGNE